MLWNINTVILHENPKWIHYINKIFNITAVYNIPINSSEKRFPIIPFKMTKTEWENNEEIKIFREYLRIPSVHPNVDYSKLWTEVARISK